MKRKVLVLDIDGTLTNSKKEITQATKNMLWKIMGMGHKVILASGRPTPGMRRYEEELKLGEYGGYLLSFNGGRIVDCTTGEIVYQRILPENIISEIFEFIKDKQCGMITYEKDKIISAYEPDEYVLLESRINGMDVKEVDSIVDYVDFDVNKCLLTAENDLAAEIEKELQAKYGDALSIYRSEPFFVEIMPKNVDKAASLDKMLEKIGFTQEDTICCGDGFNDMSMIKYANVGVAMANAQAAVKEAADYITLSNDEDGLIPVIEKFILEA